MKTLSPIVFGFLLLFSFFVQAFDIKGYVITSNSQYYVADVTSHRSYLVKAANPDVATSLSKLKNLDTLVGTGTVSGGTINLQSIDFVSLHRLIGSWKGGSATVKFVDYSRVHFQLPNANSEYQYSIAPADGNNNWRIFFTNQSSVSLGSLFIESSKAQIEVYDSVTGEVTQRFDLQKIDQ